MGLDIRLSLGLIFMITGMILLVYGSITFGSPIYSLATGLNLNLIWGTVMLLFGIGMTLLGRRKL